MEVVSPLQAHESYAFCFLFKGLQRGTRDTLSVKVPGKVQTEYIDKYPNGGTRKRLSKHGTLWIQYKCLLAQLRTVRSHLEFKLHQHVSILTWAPAILTKVDPPVACFCPTRHALYLTKMPKVLEYREAKHARTNWTCTFSSKLKQNYRTCRKRVCSRSPLHVPKGLYIYIY